MRNTLICIVFICFCRILTGQSDKLELGDFKLLSHCLKDSSISYDNCKYTSIKIYHFKGREDFGLPYDWFKPLTLKDMKKIKNKEVYTLTNSDELELKEILSLKINYEEEKSMCMFVPHHAIVFFNGKSITAYIELCFRCNEGGTIPLPYEFSKNIMNALSTFISAKGLL